MEKIEITIGNEITNPSFNNLIRELFRCTFMCVSYINSLGMYRGTPRLTDKTADEISFDILVTLSARVLPLLRSEFAFDRENEQACKEGIDRNLSWLLDQYSLIDKRKLLNGDFCVHHGLMPEHDRALGITLASGGGYDVTKHYLFHGTGLAGLVDLVSRFIEPNSVQNTRVYIDRKLGHFETEEEAVTFVKNHYDEDSKYHCAEAEK